MQPWQTPCTRSVRAVFLHDRKQFGHVSPAAYWVEISIGRVHLWLTRERQCDLKIARYLQHHKESKNDGELLPSEKSKSPWKGRQRSRSEEEWLNDRI